MAAPIVRWMPHPSLPKQGCQLPGADVHQRCPDHQAWHPVWVGPCRGQRGPREGLPVSTAAWLFPGQEPKPSSRSRSLASRGRIQTRTREGQEKGGRGQGAFLPCKAQMKWPSPPCAPRITRSHWGLWVHRQVSPTFSCCQSDRGARSIIFVWSRGFLPQGEAAWVHRVCCDRAGEEMPGCPRGLPPAVSAGHWGKVTRLCRWGRQAQAVPGKEKVCGSLREL